MNLSSPDINPIGYKNSHATSSNEVSNICNTPVKQKRNKPLEEISPSLLNTPEQIACLNNMVATKPFTEAPNREERKIIRNASTILTKASNNSDQSPDQIPKSAYQNIFDRLGSNNSNADFSPLTKTHQANTILSKRSWASQLGNACYEKISSDEKRRSLPKYPDIHHLTDRSSNSGGFHICQQDDSFWPHMTHIHQSPSGVISAYWPTGGRKETKHSSFFPPSLSMQDIAKIIQEATTMIQYHAIKEGVSLTRHNASGLILENQEHTQNKMFYQTVYPVFLWIEGESLQSPSAITIAKNTASIESQTNPIFHSHISVSYASIRDATSKIVSDLQDPQAAKKRYKQIPYFNPTNHSIVIDIAKDLFPDKSIPRGIYVVHPVSEDICRQLQQKTNIVSTPSISNNNVNDICTHINRLTCSSQVKTPNNNSCLASSPPN